MKLLASLVLAFSLLLPVSLVFNESSAVSKEYQPPDNGGPDSEDGTGSRV